MERHEGPRSRHGTAWQAALLSTAVGALLGLAVLVVAPTVDSLDTHSLVRGGLIFMEGNYLLPNHWKLLSPLVSVISAFGVSVLLQRPARFAGGVTLGVMGAWLVRVQLDLAHDPTDHNLLPFEAAEHLVSLLIMTGIGAAVGYGVRRASDRQLQRWSSPWQRDA